MSERRYTPGPWQALRATHDTQGGGFEWWLYSPNYGCVGYWTGGKGDHKDGRWLMTENDAHLISAAPDMLDALKNLVLTCDANGLRNVPFLQDARAAIAKAEGGA